MERTKHKLLICLVFIYISLPLHAIDQTKMLQAYLSGNMHYWKEQIDLNRVKKNQTQEESLRLLTYEYGFIGYLLGIKSDKQARTYLKEALGRLEKLQETVTGESASQLYAIAAAFMGYEIGLSPWKAPIEGPESIRCAEKAIKLDDDAPWGFIQMGNIKRYSPGIFGGSKQKALNYYLKAKAQYETYSGYTKDWQYIALLVSIAQCYYETGDVAQSKIYYDALEKTYPSFQWLKEIRNQSLKK